MTLLQGKGAYSGRDKQVILCACARTQIIPVKRAAGDRPRRLCRVTCDAHEILGEGFGVYEAGNCCKVRKGENDMAGAGGGPADAALTGCGSLLNRDYSVTEPHSSSYYESEDRSVLRAESYQDLVNALLRGLISGGGGDHLALPRRQEGWIPPAVTRAGVCRRCRRRHRWEPMRCPIPDLYGGRDTSEL